MDSATEAVDPVAMRAQLRVGTTLREKWHLDQLLGVGGMAAVYAATHRNGTRAAVKMLHAELTTHGHIRSRFLKEGYVANKVDHPGVVRVIDDDVAEDGSLFLVMELLDGESLEERRVRLGGRLDGDEVLAAADQLLDVLASAHEKGIVHRDIKPENVFLTRDGQVKVLDFGIARLRELSTVSSATRVGTTMGTPCYMSPEHARGLWDEVDAQSDLWSVGATMFTLTTGRVVHEGRTTNEQLATAITQRAPSVASILPDVSEGIAALIDRALAYEKSERWPDARTMQEAARRTYYGLHETPLASHPPLAIPASVPNRTMRSAESVAVVPGAPTPGPMSAGRTDVPLHRSLATPRGAIVAAAVIGAIGVVVLGTIGIGLALRRTPTTSSAAVEPSQSQIAAALPEAAAPPVPSQVTSSSAPTTSAGDDPSTVSADAADAGKRQVRPRATPNWKDLRK